MEFKKYLIMEKFDNSNVEVGDVLAALQQLNSDIDHLKRKDLINSLETLVVGMRSLLNPKNDKRLIKVVQKIICAIKDDLESKNDFKDTIQSSIFELENYLKDKKVVINKPVEGPDSKGVSKPFGPKDNPPKEVAKNLEVTPNEQGIESNTPPLSGSGDNSINIV